MDQARAVLRFYRTFARSTPDELMVFAVFMNTPDGFPVVALLVGWFGPLSEGEQYLKPLRNFGAPLVDLIAEVPYLQNQTIFDAATPHGMPRYWKSGNLPDIEDGFIDVVLDQVAKQTSPYSFVLFFHIKGVAARSIRRKRPSVCGKINGISTLSGNGPTQLKTRRISIGYVRSGTR